MTRARRRVLAAFLVLLVVALGALALTALRRSSIIEKPRLGLLTSLPIVFGEDFSLKDTGSPALRALSARFQVAPISTTSAADLGHLRLLLMAQPQAQTPENLVALDDWVRSGGRVLLLADPMLEWPSKRPLGDSLRPPPMFADTGLLMHWGLRLDAPDERGPVRRKLDGHDILAVSPGVLSGRCKIEADGFIAECRTGKGVAVVVADADFLNVDRLGSAAGQNIDGLVAALANLQGT